VDDDAWSRFARQIVNPQVYARSRIRAGEPLPWGIGWGKLRGRGPFEVRTRWEYCHVGGVSLISPAGYEFVHAAYVTSFDGPPLSGYYGSPAQRLPVGRHIFSAAVTFRVLETDRTTGDAGSVLAEWRDERSLPVEVVAPGRDVVRAVAAPDLPSAFAETAEVSAWFKGSTLWVAGDVGPLPVDVAVRAFVEEPATGRRWDAGQTVIRGDRRDKLVVALDPFHLPEAERPAIGAVIDLVLEPDAEAARRTINVIEYANVQLRINGLKIGSH
jgi:hypothetical protein